MSSVTKNTNPQLALIHDIGGFFDDPLGFVMYNYPWGTDRLEDETGPDDWQIEILEYIGEKIRLGIDVGEAVGEAIQIVVASGHGIGKTALVAWIIDWFVSTREHPQVVVTANTQPQLMNKTWRELAKWHNMSLNKSWFKHTATRFYHVQYPETWFAAAIPWSANKSEAFAGTHEKHVLIIFDEASAIDDIIWEVSKGAMTTSGAIMIAFGNPTKNKGEFKNCFGKYRHRWKRMQIDSRTCKMADKKIIKQWEEDYGEDSDFFRVRVKGQFPRQSASQFIPEDIVDRCLALSFGDKVVETQPLIMSFDIARQGDDASVILVRRGRKILDIYEYRISDLMQLAMIGNSMIDKWEPEAFFLDANGLGWGVYDKMKELGYKPTAINWSEPALDKSKHFNLRAEMWQNMKDALIEGVDIPSDHKHAEALADDLQGPEYGFDPKNRIQLEKKEDMKRRGVASPDFGDALALTYARRVRSRGGGTKIKRNRPTASSWRTL